MKKITSLLLTLVLIFSLVSCTDSTETSSDDESLISFESSEANSEAISENVSEDASKENSDDTLVSELSSPALYKVSDENGNHIWLLGSIHVGSEKFYPLPEYVLNAFEEADALAVEVNIVEFQQDMAAMTNALSLMVYRDGTTIKDHISAEVYNEAVAILKENNFYMSAYDYYMPCFWESIISDFILMKNNIDTENGIDVTMIKKADEMKKPIYDIESAELQYGMMAGFSEKLQEMLLKSAIESYKDDKLYMESINGLVDSWAKGDVEGLKNILSSEQEFDSEEEKLLYEEYNKALSTDRDIGMVKYAEDALKSGEEIFICVGAAHVIGENAMVDSLTAKGYSVERITE